MKKDRTYRIQWNPVGVMILLVCSLWLTVGLTIIVIGLTHVVGR